MVRRRHRTPHLGHAGGHAGRRLVVNDGDRFDLPVAIVDEDRMHDIGIDAVPPVCRHELNVQAKPHGHVAPQHGELAHLEHQHGVAGRQRVNERRLPRAGAGGGVDDHRT